jgi:2'-5' RNA ligase
MFISKGELQYSEDPLKLIVHVDPGIVLFYRSLIPKYLRVKGQAYSPHISVVRKATPPYMEFWRKYEGSTIEFSYDTYIYNDDTYYWLNIWSYDLETIRKELGLKPFGDVTESPDKRHRFHCTLGNTKEI